MTASDAGNRLALLTVFALTSVAHGQQTGATDSSYLPVAIKESSAAIQQRMEAAKPSIMKQRVVGFPICTQAQDRRQARPSQGDGG